MGLFDELMRNAGKRGTAIAEADIKRKAEKEEFAAKTASEAARYAAMGDRADARYIEKADSAMDRVLANPNSIDATAAALAEQHSTVTKKPKYAKYGTKTEAVDASMNGTPLAGIGDRIKNVYATKLQDSKGTGKSIAQIQQEAVSEVMTPELVQASYEHKAKADSSITNLFGLFSDDSDVKAADGKALGMVGYDTWKANVKADREKRLDEAHAGLGIASTGREQLLHDAFNASLGAAGSLVVGGMALAAPTAGTSLVPTVGGAAVLIGGSLLRGALMAGTGRIASAVSRAYEKTDFATFHEGDAQERGFGAVVGGAALAAGAKGSGLKTMIGLGTAGAAIGAASPTTAVDFLGWTGAQAIADKGGEMALKRFANLGARSEAALNNLAHDPTGAKVVEKFKADKALAGAKEAIDLETLKTAAEKTLYEAEFARMEKGKALTDVLERRKLSMMPNETGATVNKSLREADGDVVSLAQELQDARRMATPGGPNATSVAAPVVKKTGKGKKAVSVDAEEQQMAVEKVHFNAFLDEQKEAGLAVRRQAEATQEVYSKLFAVANRPTDLSEGLSKLSWDGLNKVIGEGAEEGWKVLSIGERVQIVSGAESAAHAALMRGKGTVAGADRLDSLTGALVKAVREGMKGAPEDLSNALQKVVERKGSPYVKNGQTDLQTLQTDLADHGFESVQQLAFTLAKDKPKASVKKLAAFEEATTAVRNSFGSNLVKLGIGGAATTGAMGLYDPSDSHAGVFDAVFKAGGKVFNNAAKETVALAKFPAKITVKDGNLYKELNRWGGISRDEFNYYELDKIPAGTTLTKGQLATHIAEREPLVEVREAIVGGEYRGGYEASEEYSRFKAIPEHPESKLVPDSYTEGFVEVKLQKRPGKMQPDEHPEYQNSGITENTLVRYRMDKSVGSDGKKEFILQEVQEPSHVRVSRVAPEAKALKYIGNGDGDLAAETIRMEARSVPHALAIRAQDFAVKQILAKAKAEGVERIVLPTGEQQKSLYAGALRDVIDSAEYDPITQMLSPMKNGEVVKNYPQKIAPEKIADHIGEKNAEALLANAGKEKVGRITDITFDAKWPDALYGSMGPNGFNFKAKIPATVLKYAGKGATTGAKAGQNEEMLIHNLIGKPLPDSFSTLHHGTFKAGTIVTPELAAKLEGYGINKLLREKYSIVDTQPYIDLPKDMSTNYTLFSHPASLIGAAGIAATMAGVRVGDTNEPTPASEEIKGRYLGDEVMAAVEAIGEKLDPLVSLLGPAEAEAGGFDAAVKLFGNLKTSQAAAAVLADAGKSGTEALKYAHDAGLVFTELPRGAVSARGHRVGYIDTAPKGTAEMKEIVRRLSNVVPGQGFATPYFNSQTLLKTANDGDRFLGNPAIQLAHGQSAVSHNARQSLTVLDNIYKVNGVKLSKANSTAIETAMLPVQKAYDAVSTPLRASEAAAGHLRKELKYLTETSAKDAEFAANMAPAVEAKKAAIAAMEDEIRALRPAFNDAKADVEIYQRAMAMRFPEARLSLAVEDTADFAQRPWLRELLTPGEKQAVLQIQDVMAEYGERITAIMGKDSVITGGYVKHSRTFLPEQAKRLSDLEAKLDKLGLNGKETLALTKLHERTLYSQQMIPDIGRNMADYVPDVEKRLMNADFWNKWKPFKDSTTVKNSPALKGMFDRIAESARPAEDTALRRFSSNYAKVETIRLLAGLASAPAKHLFKVLGDVSQLGLLNTTSVMADAAGTGMRNFVRIQGQKLAKAGFISEDTAAGLFTKNKDVDSFAAAIINQRGMVDYLSDLEKIYGVGHRSTINKILDPLTEVAGMGIKVVETFDRTVSVLAAAKMAQKNGLTGQQAMYGIYDTILKNNFLSGQLNSAWAKDPNVRALFLFQNTPFKIWERRVSNASIAGADLKTALGVIKAQDLPAAKAELEGMRKWAAQASQAFKNGMLMDALNSSKDVFGNSVSGQFVREALGVGVVLGAGSMAGVNLSGHLLHTPFVSAGFSGAPEVSMSPLVKAGFNTAVGKKPAGFDDWDSDDHSRVADFFKHWYGTAGYSLMASKFGRISNGDIPEQYRDSKFKFLFAMPATAEK